MTLIAVQLSRGSITSFLLKFNKLIFFKQRMYGLKCVKTIGLLSNPTVSQAQSFTPYKTRLDRFCLYRITLPTYVLCNLTLWIRIGLFSYFYRS
jgi:hypothetical protein